MTLEDTIQAASNALPDGYVISLSVMKDFVNVELMHDNEPFALFGERDGDEPLVECFTRLVATAIKRGGER